MDTAITAGAHQAKVLSLGRIYGEGANGELGAGVDVVLNKTAVVHPVELVTGKNQVVVHVPFVEKSLVLTDCIGRALKPAWAFWGLLGCQNLHKALAESSRKVVAHRQVTIQRRTIELGKYIDFIDFRINAIADWNIN